MSRLLEGLERVIKGGKPEELSKSQEAPKLPELSDTSSVDFGDWLYLMEHVMSDLSASSAEWWRVVTQDAQEFYEKYQAADQFTRLSMKPASSPELLEARWSRLDRRGAAILLGAAPEDVKKELVAARTKSTLEVLARLMVVYRPGSALEKGQLLRRIENPESASTVQDAIEGLRQWLRHYQRAKDLKLSIPDPSVTLRGLDVLVKKPVQDNPEVAFRMNLIRYHLKVDFSPSEEAVLAVHRALLAEFEQMGYKKRVKPQSDGGGQVPRVRAMETQSAQATTTPLPTSPTTSQKGTTRPCRFYTTDEGCRRGKACKYEHTMKDLSKMDRRDRCYECGAKGHMAASCPTRKEVQQKAVAAGDSPASSTGGTGGRGGKGGKGQRPNEGGDGGGIASATTSTATTTPAATEAPVQGVPVEQLIEDAQKLMKAFMEQKAQPTVQALRVDGEEFKRTCEAPALREFMKQNEDLIRMNRMGLLDSGATHPLRARNERDQPGATDNVNVTLAGETRVQMEQNKAGTIISHQDAQPIVPLGTLVKALGYEFVWDRKGCRLRHPDRKEVRVYTRSTCPEVMQCDALRLIAELEEPKLTETMSSLAQLKASVAAAREHQEKSWRDHVRDYVTSGVYEDGVKAVRCAPFMHHVPMRDQLQTIVPLPKDEGEAWQWMKRFPLNRAKRRTLWQTRDWSVHMFSGTGVKNDPLRDLPGLVEMDIKKGWDFNDDKIYGVVLWMAKQGRVKHVIGGPPAGTFSPWHYKKDQEGRQRSLRSTHEPWGLREGLSPDESSKVLNENVMLCKMVWLWLCAEAAHARQGEDDGSFHVGFCMEYPEDPHNYMPEGEHRSACVSLWRTEFMKEFIVETNLFKYQFEQGALGHMFRRPTCCLSNLSLGIQGRKDQRAYVAADTKDVDQSVWPHGFRITVADAIHEWRSGESPVVLRKVMTKKELDEWKAHVERGHWPYRRDCSVCLAASGTGRPARRVIHRDAYVMSLDIAGPFADKGRDEVRGQRYRFVLAATYLYPKVREVPEDIPIPNEEEAEEFLRDEEDDEVQPPEVGDDPEIAAQEEEWKKKVADLSKPIELQMLRFCIPLERHTGKEILECIQDLYVQLRAMGLPLTRIHSDRGREFRVKPVRKWCRDRDIYQTFTEGLTPTQNAVAESHVKWLKSRARVYLNEKGLDKELWPCAMKYACFQHNARQLGTKMEGVKFGSVVWVKSKKERGPFDPKWERGKYMGPADDVRGGHVVCLDDGLWLRTLHMRTVRDDEVEFEDEEHVVDLIEPTKRVRGKTKLSDPEMRAIRKQERNALVKELLESKIWDSPQAKVERPQMKEGEIWDGAAYINLGAYQHGGITSVTRATEKFNKEAILATRLLGLDHPGHSFTSVALVKNAVMPVHRDSFNHKKAMNLISPLKVAKGSCVWLELKEGDEFRGNYHPMWVDGKELAGQKLSVELPTKIRPDRLHAPLRGEKGDRIVVIGYTVSKWEKLSSHQCDDLEEMGFVLPEREPVLKMMNTGDRRSGQREFLPEMGGERLDSMVVPGGRVELRLKWAIKYIPDLASQGEEVVMTSAPLLPLAHDEEERMRSRVTWLSEFVEEERKIKARQAERGEYATQRERQLFYKLDDAIDYMNEILCLSHQAREQATMNMMKLMQEAEATPEIEEMLQALVMPIDTVHGVELQEVKRHLEKWRESIQKEIEVLETSGTLRRISLSEAKRLADAGEIVLVPSKTVHTIKPPSGGSGDKMYKRKTRMVICGNYVSNEVEVYTAAANAESVRVALSFAAHRRWFGAVTDVNSAFTLAPMDEAAARLWGSFRDKRVQRARPMVGGQECMFVQMETDPAVWRLVACSDRKVTLALMVIYVDDVMMLGPEQVVKDIYEWLTVGVQGDEGWKCSPMEWLGKAPVRYLGMDIRRKDGSLTSFHVSQGSYVGELLKGYPMEASRPSQVPATKDTMPSSEDQDEEEMYEQESPDPGQVKQAQRMAGELLWLVTRTRPDIGYATAHVCATALKSPTASIRLGKMVMRYLAATPTWGLTYNGVGEPVEAYSDASFAPQGDRSFGCVTTATYGGFAAWRMTKQPTVVLSAAEAELVELVNASQQAAGLQAWVEEVSPQDAGKPLILRVDNTAACGLATTSPGSWKTRHLKVKARHLRFETNEGRIKVVHTPGEVQAADMGTKPVPMARLVDLRKLWGMCSAEDFDTDEEEVIVRSLRGGDYYDLLRMMAWMMMVSRIPGTKAAGIYHKTPLDYDGSVEFYILLVVGGIALLAIWEAMKWLINKVVGPDEATLQKARRLLRIRDQAARALQEELDSMSASSSDPIGDPKRDKEDKTTPTATMPFGTTSSATTRPTIRVDDDPDLQAALSTARANDYRRLRTNFVMSEYGDRLHVVSDCHGLRHANKSKLKKIQMCHYCDSHFPLSYRITEGRVIPEG
ncbi:Retrovirus-related Pol polyprotein from transposon TNT 1-94 [Symbiodinium microadriaticum]|uniref:Retrovirus-related Pol polyprotein from transposon TNT 1-94 n=1 Tax=Symbiodinium microadriaticum TaxID=2951 RepID=A0A1Q9DUM6_SYMMI|nr:Retrovirus-related Pol polyprotein from transposon TNT 1-94 [Symbiodinium microadriaticum]